MATHYSKQWEAFDVVQHYMEIAKVIYVIQIIKSCNYGVNNKYFMIQGKVFESM